MALQHLGFIELPANIKPGGFDHAAVHAASGRVYVAHTCNDALDVIDGVNDRYLHSIPNLAGVAGALVSDERDLVMTSNRGENTVGIFTPDDEAGITRVSVGVRPNGMAFDPASGLLLAANVGDPNIAGATTVSIVDVAGKVKVADVSVPGRTRWTIFDPQSGCFYVNIMEPARIVVVDAGNPTHVSRAMDVPVAGPHGLDLDVVQRHLFCTCDGKKLVTLDADTGSVLDQQSIGDVPDVIFFNAALQHLYIAIGDPGVIEVFDTHTMQRIETVPTESGAHTLAFDAARNKVYAFCPRTHHAIVYGDSVP